MLGVIGALVASQLALALLLFGTAALDRTSEAGWWAARRERRRARHALSSVREHQQVLAGLAAAADHRATH